MLTNASVDFERNFNKAPGNANLYWPVFPHCSGPYLMPTGHFCCPVSTGHLRHPSPTAFSEFLCPTPHWRSLPTSGHVEIAGSGLCLVSYQNRQRDGLLDGPPTLCYSSLGITTLSPCTEILSEIEKSFLHLFFVLSMDNLLLFSVIYLSIVALSLISLIAVWYFKECFLFRFVILGLQSQFPQIFHMVWW